MRNLSLVSVALVAVASAAPAFAHGHNYPRRAAEAAFGAVEAPQFVRVGPMVIGSRRPGAATPMTVRGESKTAKVEWAAAHDGPLRPHGAGTGAANSHPPRMVGTSRPTVRTR